MSSSESNIPIKFSFRVEFIGTRPLPRVKDYAQQIIQWYYNTISPMDSIDFFGMSNIKLFYDSRNNLFHGTFIPTEGYDEDIGIPMYVDHDDDGNYPIVIEDKEYLIIGIVV